MFNKINEFFHKRSKKPWAQFIVSGIQSDGQVRFEMAWNPAFIKNIKKHGFEAESEEISVQHFLIATFLIPTGVLDNEVVSEEHPHLQSEKNQFRR